MDLSVIFKRCNEQANKFCSASGQLPSVRISNSYEHGKKYKTDGFWSDEFYQSTLPTG